MFQDLSSLLHRHVQRKGLAYQVEAAMSLQHFDTVVEHIWRGKMKDRVRALYLKDHILTVAVLSPVLSQELRNNQAEIIDFINKKLGVEAVDKLRFVS